MPPPEPAWAAVVVNYEAGDLLAACVASLVADDSAGPAEVVVVDNGSRDGSLSAPAGRAPGVEVVVPGPQPRLRRGGQLGHRGHHRAGRGGVQPRPRGRAGHRGGRARALRRRVRSRRARAADREPRRHAVPLGASRSRPSSTSIGHALLGLVAPRQPVHPPLPRARRRPGATTRRRLGVGGHALPAPRPRSTSVGGWDERYFMYFEDVDLCWRLRRLGWRVAYEPGGRGRPPPGGEHRPRARTG